MYVLPYTDITTRMQLGPSINSSSSETIFKLKKDGQVDTTLLPYTEIIPRMQLGPSKNCSYEMILKRKRDGQDFKVDISSENERKMYLFERRLQEEDKNRFFLLLDTFHKLSIEKNFTYFIAMGTMLGSYRHHDMVPWDDDLDIMIPLYHKYKIKELYENITDQDFLSTSDITSKIYLPYGKTIFQDRTGSDPHRPRYGWTFPFLDMFYYQESKTHLLKNIYHHKTALDIIFPLKLRPLNKKLYFGPRDPHKYIKVQGYDIDQCYTGYYNHSFEYSRPQEEIATLPCAALLNKIPFVEHIQCPGGAWCKEVLHLGNQSLSEFMRSKENVADC